MATVQQAFDLAFQHHQAGRLAEAETLYRQILAVQPNHVDALHYLGLAAHQAGRHDLAVQFIGRAIALHPHDSAAHSNLGVAWAEQERWDDAIGAYRAAIALDPNRPESHNNLGNALRERGELAEAVAEFRRALESQPDYAEALHNLSIALRERGELEEALAAAQRVVRLKPHFAEAHDNLGTTLQERGQFEEAVAAYHRALELQPAYAKAYNNLGNVLKDRGRFDEAIAAYRRALELRPDDAKIHSNLAVALQDRGQIEEAIAACQRALKLQPDLPQAHNNLGNAFLGRGQGDAAVAEFRRALALKPDYAEAHNNLGNALKERGEIEEAIGAYRCATQLEPDCAALRSNLIYTLHFLPGQDGLPVDAEQQQWNRRFSAPRQPFLRPYTNDRDAERRLRIGYVSAEFRDHVIGRNLFPLLQSHEQRNFEICCYSGVLRPDEMTAAFRRCADQWRDTVGVKDEALAEMIRQDGVDILVDLTQHLAGNRLPVFARQPAPVQVSFAGYPESTGVEGIEYRISDRWLEVDTEREERVFLLDSFWCYDPCGMEVKVNELPAKASGHVTFGSLNNFCKINEPLLRLWARVLREVAEARLVMLSGLGSHRQRTVEFLEREGIAASRVEFVGRCSRRAYLELYHRLDVVLDTFPYNGHTTSLDALWMGVPVVSLAGKSAVSRAGLSQLSNLGLPELVAHAEDEYVDMATRLARDFPRLAELRTTLRGCMEASVLMDAPRFARSIEAAYRAMWRRFLSNPRQTA